MRRRLVLSTLCVGLFGGCLSDFPPSTRSESDSTRAESTSTTTQTGPVRRTFGRVTTEYRQTDAGNPADADPGVTIEFDEDGVVVSGTALVACQTVRVADAGYDGADEALNLAIVVERTPGTEDADCGQGAIEYRVAATVDAATTARATVTQHDDGESVTKTAAR